MTYVPIDPQDLDKLPPPDLDVCDHCGGAGAVWPTSGDPQDVEPCPVCQGDGIILEFLIPTVVSAGRVGCPPMPQPRPAGTQDGAP